MRGRNRIFGILALTAFCATSAFGLGGGGGTSGGSFNAASPGPIGGTTSSTVQATQLCVGPSPCTLPGTIGDITAARSGGVGVFNLGSGGTAANLVTSSDSASNAVLQLDTAGTTVFTVGNVYNRLRSGLVFANLPSCSGFEGSVASITDSTVNTVGAIIAGSGTFHVLAYCDGTNWTVAATTGPSARSWLAGSSNAVVSNSAANFFPATGTGTAVASTSEGGVSTLAATVSTLRNLKCVLTSIAGVVTVAGGTSYVVALRQNIATSALTCTITSAISSCADTTHTVTTAVGDQLDYIDTPSGTPTALVVKCTLERDS